jgi:anti-sigma factor RsiW
VEDSIVTCRALANFIADYLTGGLDPSVRAEFDRHLTLCPNCQRYLALYKATTYMSRQAFADADEPAEAAGVPQDLIDAILASRPR